MLVAFEVDRDEFVVRHGEDPFQRSVCRGRKRAVHFLCGRRLVQDGGEIDERHVGRGHADGDAVQLSFELGEHFTNRDRRAGRRRNHRQRGRTRAPQVLVRQVEQLLIVGVGVNRRHPPLLDAERLMQHLRQRRKAIGRARCVGNDLMPGRIVGRLVDAEHERDVRSLGRRRDDDLLRARRDVLRRRVTAREEPGRFEHDVDAEILPRQLRRIFL